MPTQGQRLASLVAELPSLYDAIPPEGGDREEIDAAYAAFHAQVAAIRQTWDTRDGYFDFLSIPAWMTVSTMVECLERATDLTLDGGGGDDEWNDLNLTIHAFAFVLTHPTIAHYLTSRGDPT